MNAKIVASMLLCGLVVFGSACSNNATQDTVSSTDMKQDSKEPMPVSDDQYLIESYGDSTTLGETVVNGKLALAESPTPAGLEKLLRAEFGPTISVINEGVSGSQAIQLLDGTDGKHPNWQSQMSRSKAKIVILNFGLNEAYYLKVPNPNLAPISPDKYAEVMSNLVEIATSAGKIVVLNEPNPTCDKDRANGVEYYATYLDQVAAKKSVPLVGNYWEISKQADWQKMLLDCVHPNQSLYDAIAKRQFDVVKPLISINSK